MEYVAIACLGIAAGVLFMKAKDNKEILKLEQENCELRAWKLEHRNVAERAITMDRKLRNVRKIIEEDAQKGEFDTITLSKIRKELLMNR